LKPAFVRNRAFFHPGIRGNSPAVLTRSRGGRTADLCHLSGKGELFTCLIEKIFANNFVRIDEPGQPTVSAFEQIRRLIELQFDIIDEMPDEVSKCSRISPNGESFQNSQER